MKKVLMIFSHYGSGSDHLFDALSNHPKIDGFRTGYNYENYDQLLGLWSHLHKNETTAAMWMDEVLHNHQFTCKPLLPYIKSIFVIREPLEALPAIVAEHPEYDMKRAADYYRYRLSGLCEYAHRSPKSPVFDSRSIDLGKIESYLGIKDLTGLKVPEKLDVHIPNHILAECEESYEDHLNHLYALGSLSSSDHDQRR